MQWKKKIPVIILLAALISTSLSVCIDQHWFTSHSREPDLEALSGFVVSREKMLDLKLNECSGIVDRLGLSGFRKEAQKRLLKDYAEDGVILLIYNNGKLIFWSDHTFVTDVDVFSRNPAPEVVFLNNAWVLVRSLEDQELKIIALAPVKRQYSVSNDYLETAFAPGFNVPSGFTISVVPTDNGYSVAGTDGEYRFSLIPDEGGMSDENWAAVPVSMAAIIFLYIAFILYLRKVTAGRKTYMLAGFALLIIAVRACMMYFQFPAALYSSMFFQPDLYASSVLLPSLGDLLLNVLFLLVLLMLYYREFELLRKDRTIVFVQLAFSILLVLLFDQLLAGLVAHSSIDYSLYNILGLHVSSVIALFIYVALFASAVILFDKAARTARNAISAKWMIISATIFFIVFSALLAIFARLPSWPGLSFLYFTFIVCLFIRYRQLLRPGFSYAAILAFLGALFVSFHILVHFQDRQSEVRRVIAVGLTNERDLLAEMLLEDIDEKLGSDVILAEMVHKQFEKRYEVFQYLRENYFFGYWTKYDLQTTVCTPLDNLKIEQTGEFFRCFDYFSGVRDNMGVQVPNTHFHFIDNNDGRISYLGMFEYPAESDSLTTRLFIEFDSRLLGQDPGYPDLLMEQKVNEASLRKNYSYARYRNGKLIARYGDFLYSLSERTWPQQQNGFQNINYEGYMHTVYRIDERNSIVVSVPELTLYNKVISFSYVFMLHLFVFGLFYLIRSLSGGSWTFNLNIKARIQFSFIAILLFSFVLIGSISVYYIVSQYHRKNNETISEKIQSVLVEVEHKLGQDSLLSESRQEYVSALLIKFSNVFFSDINLYDTDGKLFATSRPEIFQKGLIGNMMNPRTYYALHYQKKPEVIQEEMIGSQEYLSAYVPFTNSEGKLMAYLNLPYFTKQQVLTRELSTFVTTLLNIYVLLSLLAIAIAVLVANGLTRPLVLLQRRFREIDFTRKNEPIPYKRADEIGVLVKEYNRMLEELAYSAEMLARSERESAWREMARQVAHEIKNPLTPMKLSVQHLMRSHQEKSPGWEGLVEKTSRTLIDQIDALSAIASEFSLFARMPGPAKENVDLNAVVQSVVDLYSPEGKIEFLLQGDDDNRILVKGDKEQLLRVFGNLVKNAIQAIPPGTNGIISIHISDYPGTAVVKITDNGTGIPEELKEKLFIPNFTTKTSGMGLGLAIVKNLIEGMGGSIRFITSPGSGTTFFVELPKV